MSAQETVRHLAGDRYTLEGALGRGGMGVVWHAHDTRLRRRVAIKEVRLPPALSDADRDALQGRVLREARVAARLSDPSAVTVYDVFSEAGTSYIVMELVDAPTLREVVERNGPLPAARVAEIGLQVLGALERAHEQGIVHRDVKPDNIMVSDEGRAKLADFGIASLKGDATLTATGIVLGSPSFMAPEQAQDDDSGPPADLWALGATLYFAVEGVAPFERGAAIPTLTAVVHDPPRAPQRAGVLGPIIMRLLSKAPEDRPSAAEVMRELAAVSGDGSRPARAVAAAAAVTQAVAARPAATDALWDRESRPGPRRAEIERQPAGRSHRWPLAAAAAFLVALAALAFAFLAPGDRSDPAAGSDRGPRRRQAEQQGSGGGAWSAASEDNGGETGATLAAEEDAPTTTADSAVSPPRDWVPYTDEATGFSISHPPDWSVIPQPSDGDSVDFRDPSSGAYLRVDWTDTPGPSPQQAWLDYEPEFAARHDNYERIQLTPTTFQGFEASLWEFTYSDGGTGLHAYDLGFVTGEHGFALNFQTRAEHWEEMSGLFEAFKATFEPPA